jgi:transposase
VAGWKDVAVPKPYPREFRDDVVRVARNRGDGVTVEQIAKDFGVHPMTLFKWLRQADVDAGAKPGTSSSESAELRQAQCANQVPAYQHSLWPVLFGWSQRAQKSSGSVWTCDADRSTVSQSTRLGSTWVHRSACRR